MSIENRVGYAQNAFLGKEARNEDFVEAVYVVANKVDEILNPMDDAAKKKVNGDSIRLVHDLGISVGQVSILNDTLQDPNKTSTQKENANVALDLLAKGVYVAMRYGRNQGARDALCGGSVVEVENILPEPLKGLGERIRANIIDEPQIIEILDNLDVQRKKYENGGSLGKKSLVKKIEEAYNQLADLSVESIYEDQLGMVMDFLGVEAEELGVVGLGGSDTNSVQEIAKIVMATMEGGAERSESTYQTFTTAEFLQQPIQLQVDTFPPSWFKRAPEWFEGSTSDWQQIIRARINLTNASYIKAEVAALDGEKAKNNSYLKLSERELGLMYEFPGVRESMENIMDDFFEASIDPDSGAYFLKLKKANVIGLSWRDRLAAFRDYQEELIAKFKNEQGWSDENARAAVSMAWNFLYVCNVFESADDSREISGGSGNVFGEQIRAMMHPLSKAQRKFGVKPDLDENSRSEGTEEGWGGNVGAWFADMMTWSDTRPNFIRDLQNGSLKPYPERIGASMIELMEVTVDGGRKMSMAQALMEKKHIRFSKTDANLFGDYGDKWDTFFKFYQYASGKNLLDVNKNLDEWSNGLADVLAKMKGISVVGGDGKMFMALDTPVTFGWIMLNSMGIVRSPDLMVRVPDGIDYEGTVDRVLQQPRLLPEKNRRGEVKRMLHAGVTEGIKRVMIKVDSMKRFGRTK